MFCILFPLAFSGFKDTKSFTSGWGGWLSSLASLRKSLKSGIDTMGSNPQIVEFLKTDFQYYDLEDLNKSLDEYLQKKITPILDINQTFYNNFKYFKDATMSLNGSLSDIQTKFQDYADRLMEDISFDNLNFSFDDLQDAVFLGDYVKAGISIGVSYLGCIFLFLLLLSFAIIYTFVACYGCCCCKRAKKANWPGVVGTVFFWTGIVLYLIGAIFRITGLAIAKDYGNIFIEINETA